MKFEIVERVSVSMVGGIMVGLMGAPPWGQSAVAWLGYWVAWAARA